MIKNNIVILILLISTLFFTACDTPLICKKCLDKNSKHCHTGVCTYFIKEDNTKIQQD